MLAESACALALSMLWIIAIALLQLVDTMMFCREIRLTRQCHRQLLTLLHLLVLQRMELMPLMLRPFKAPKQQLKVDKLGL